jgi:superfamily II DNA helicase RecQ
MFTGSSDVADLRRFLTYKAGDAGVPHWKMQCLDEMVKYVNLTTCRRRALLEYFGEAAAPAGGSFQCTGCDNCENKAQSADLTSDFRTLCQAIIFCGGRTGYRKPLDFILGKPVPEADRGRSGDPTHLPFYGKGKARGNKYWEAVLALAQSSGLISRQQLRLASGRAYDAFGATTEGQRLCDDPRLTMLPVPVPAQLKEAVFGADSSPTASSRGSASDLRNFTPQQTTVLEALQVHSDYHWLVLLPRSKRTAILLLHDV